MPPWVSLALVQARPKLPGSWPLFEPIFSENSLTGFAYFSGR